jgi:uncharacterized protein YukE
MMIAALAGTTPAKNNAIKQGCQQCADYSTRLASTFGGDASSRASRANSARWKSAIRAMVMISPTSATGPPSRANLV